MGLLDFFKLNKKQQAISQGAMIRFLNGMPIVYDQNVQSYLEEGFLGNSVIYSMVDIIGKKFSSIPWYVYSKKNDAKLKAYKAATSIYSTNLLPALQLKKASLDEVEGTKLNELLDRPNPNDSWSDLLYEAIGYRKVVGAGALHKIRSEGDGRLLGVENLPAHELVIIGDGTLNGIASYYIQTLPTLRFDKDDVMYWRYKNLDFNANGAHLYGLSPIRAAVKDIAANNYGKDAQNSMFKNGGAAGVLTTDDPTSLSIEEQGLLKQRIDEFINSRSQKGKIVPINAKVSWLQVGMDSVDMKLIEALKLSKEDLVNIYNFPINLLSDERATENNKEQALKYLVTNTIYADLVSFRDQFNKEIAPLVDKDLFIDFDITMLPELQDDMEKLSNILQKSWWVTPNEKRYAQRFDLLDDENMNQVYIPSNMVLLSDVAEPINPPMNNPDTSDYDG